MNRVLRLAPAIFIAGFFSPLIAAHADVTDNFSTSITRAAPAIVLAQAGSTGGAIGKQGKSASGGEDPAPPKRSPPRRTEPKRQSASAPTAISATTFAGRWRIDAKCNNGDFVWNFTMREASPTTFEGDYDPGQIINGKISGNQVSFTGRYQIDRKWTATVSRAGTGLSMRGSFDGASPGDFMGHAAGRSGNCTFTGTKG